MFDVLGGMINMLDVPQKGYTAFDEVNRVHIISNLV